MNLFSTTIERKNLFLDGALLAFNEKIQEITGLLGSHGDRTEFLTKEDTISSWQSHLKYYYALWLSLHENLVSTQHGATKYRACVDFRQRNAFES